MGTFPRTRIESLSVPRLVIGTNWFLGFSHTSAAKDRQIRAMMTAERIAEILEVFMNAGVDLLYGVRPDETLERAIEEAEQRTGRRCFTLSIPSLNTEETPAADDENARTLDALADLGISVCMPHQCTTDQFVSRRHRSLAGIEKYLAMIRERGMIPGLSTHMPETIGYADATDLDIATYIQIYNAAGFLMQIEVDWVHRSIWRARKPVIAIKPLAAGRLVPLVGLAFVWSTLRDQDMVCVGTSSPDEAREVIDISLAQLERRAPTVELQQTRSKASLDGGR